MEAGIATVWEMRVYENQQLVHQGEVTAPVVLGRQSEKEEGLYSQKMEAGRCRVIIARREEQTVSRSQALLEPLADGKARVSNLSERVALRLQEGTELKPKAACDLPLPVVLNLGKRTVRFLQAAGDLQSLAEFTRRPGVSAAASVRFPTLMGPAVGAVDSKALIRWIQGAMGVFQNAANAADFFAKAAEAVVEMVGLDCGQVLLFADGDWKTQASHTAPRIAGEPDWKTSRRVLNRVRQEKRTSWQELSALALDAGSLAGVRAVVAAPVLDRNGEVIGALYGDRRFEGGSAILAPVSELDAMLVELIAGGVAAGLARLEQEQAILAARVQFEQFFTPELSRQLAVQPDLLKGRDAEVSILFADIRGFSRISERLGPAGTVEWIGDVMGALSECVLAHEGVLVDYIGDELMAMWGAPTENAEHAQLACRAALDMLGMLPKLNERWRPTLKEAMGIGIGINTGVARVGNTGSQHKFKYGPLGNTVNLASRVQGATKYLQTRLVITGATEARLDAGIARRRLCSVRVVNIGTPVDLYEIVPHPEPGWSDLKEGYENAWEEFRRKEFRNACRILGALLTAHPDDGPCLVLLSRALNFLIEPAKAFDPVWELPGK